MGEIMINGMPLGWFPHYWPCLRGTHWWTVESQVSNNGRVADLRHGDIYVSPLLQPMIRENSQHIFVRLSSKYSTKYCSRLCGHTFLKARYAMGGTPFVTSRPKVWGVADILMKSEMCEMCGVISCCASVKSIYSSNPLPYVGMTIVLV